jgi:hypothetical protein
VLDELPDLIEEEFPQSNWQRIPIELTDIHQRYSDVPQTKMHAPTFDGWTNVRGLADRISSPNSPGKN